MKKIFISIFAICLVLFFYKFGNSENNNSENSLDNQEVIEREINQDNNIDTETVIKKIRIFERIQKLKDKKDIKDKIIKFYDEKNKLRKEKILQKNEFSKLSSNRKKLGILKCYNRFVDKKNKDELQLYNDNGELLRKYEVEQLSECIINNNGSFTVFGSYPTNEYTTSTFFCFYDQEGKLIKKEEFDVRFYIAYSSDRKYFYLLTEKAFMNKNIVRDTVYLICFDDNGNEVWRKSIKAIIDGGMFPCIFFDKELHIIKIHVNEKSNYKDKNEIGVPTIRIFDLNGNEISKNEEK